VLKKIWIPCCLIVLILSFSFITVNSEELKGPIAFIAEPVFSFDPVPEGQKIIHDYLIENKGNSVLSIEKIKAG
jgi:hypothetical protein